MKNKTWKLTLALLAAAFVIGGCNTMEGAGKDIERGGEKIQEQSRR
ncbi:MAG: entericidin A/B family lipoprotein [Zoogloeaceae bacterium]|nr:entericidin A/B family lipoprotein [Zoogloeaceae bacterium]